MREDRRKSVIRTTGAMAIMAVVLVSCALLFFSCVTRTLRDETRQNLREVARQSAEVIAKRIDSDMRMLEAIALFMGEQPAYNEEEAIRVLREEAGRTVFKRMGLIYPGGKTLATDGVEMKLDGRDYFTRAMGGETVVSQALTDYSDGEPIYVYATPVRRGGTVVAVLFATNAADTFASTINVRMFEGEGYSYLSNAEGDILLHPNHPDSDPAMTNVFSRMEEGEMLSAEDLSRMRHSMSNGGSGVVEYTRDGERRYLSYTPIGVNGWYVISAVSGRVVAAKSTYLTLLTLVMCVSTVAALILLFGYILFIQGRRRRELEHTAYTDPVTGGSNWNKFARDARAAVGAAGAADYSMVSFDIDRFKVFNDQFGHDTGNQLLRFLWELVRENTGEGELFARVSADNYCILIKRGTDEEIAARLRVISGALNVGGLGDPFYHYVFTLSFGVYHIGRGEWDVSLMSDRAGIARKAGKSSGVTTVAFYDHAVRDRIVKEKKMEDEMEAALENGEFVVYYQPKYSVSTREIVGAEALVRWERPGMGLVPPGDFIPLFERDGFVVRIDAFVLEETCRRMRAWADAGQPPIPVSVNVSRRNLHNPGYVRGVREMLEKHGVPSGLIELELTESTVLDFENISRLQEMMQELQAAGFLLSMDDFGSGYSSLNLLRRLPVDVLKLDRAFFDDGADPERGHTVIAGMAALARELDIMVVAEGVETAEQVEFLTSIGCDVVQGYYFARPMPAEAFERLRAGEAAAAK